MARRPKPTRSNREFAAERIRFVAHELTNTYATALEPMRNLTAGNHTVEDVVDAHGREVERSMSCDAPTPTSTRSAPGPTR